MQAACHGFGRFHATTIPVACARTKPAYRIFNLTAGITRSSAFKESARQLHTFGLLVTASTLKFARSDLAKCRLGALLYDKFHI